MTGRLGTGHFRLAMTPLIDIVFQLIAFFIFSLSYAPEAPTAHIQPPRGPETLEPATVAAVLIEVDREGRLLRPAELAVLSPQELLDGLQEFIKHLEPEHPIVVRADEQTPFAAVDQILAGFRGRDEWNIALRLRTEAQP